MFAIFDVGVFLWGGSTNSLKTTESSVGEMNNIITNVDGHATPVKAISKTKSYVGNYADIDGDGTIDGIIYADLAFDGSGIWNPSGQSYYNSPGTFSYSAISADFLKDYHVSQSSYTDVLGGTSKVISPITGTSGQDRFYVMTLNNFNELETYYWYYGVGGTTSVDDYASVTSTSFGSGMSNTKKMIEKWNNEAYGPKDGGPLKFAGLQKDVFSEIQNDVNNGWCIPSKEEWNAFSNNLKITKENYSSKGLRDSYWSSSLKNATHVYYPCFSVGFMYSLNLDYDTYYVRLSTTF